MLEQLEDLLPVVNDDLYECLCSQNLEGWDSLIINRRKPHTYRIFKQFGEFRVCLHKFEPCESDEAFFHPHPWPGAFLVLQGEYEQSIGYSSSLVTNMEPVMKMVMVAGSRYEIVNPQTWHSVTPIRTTYTIMVNGAPFPNQHKEVRTTKGKDLEKMATGDLYVAINNFHRLLSSYT